MPAEQKIVLQTKKQGSKDTRMNEKWIPLIQRSVRIRKKNRKWKSILMIPLLMGPTVRCPTKNQKNICKQSKEKQTNADDSY